MAMETFIDSIKALEALAKIYKGSTSKNTINDLVLSYIRKDNYDGTKWDINAGTVDNDFVTYVKNNDKSLYDNLQPITKQDELVDNLDMAHTMATCDAYFSPTIPADFWAGWGGDLATGIEDGYNVRVDKGYSAKTAAIVVIGTSSYHCSLTDLKADADAIKLASLCDSDFLSGALTDYYITNDYYKNRFTYLAKDIYSSFSSSTSVSTLADKIYDKMTGRDEVIIGGLLWQLCPFGRSDYELMKECCYRLAELIIYNL